MNKPSMKKFYLLLTLSSCIAAQVFAQTAEFQFREALPLGGSLVALIRQNDLKFPNLIDLQILGKGGKELAHTELNLHTEGARTKVESTFKWGNRLNLLLAHYYPAQRSTAYELVQLSLDSLKTVLVKSFGKVRTPPIPVYAFCGYSISPDSSKMMFFNWPIGPPQDSVNLLVQVFDQKMESLWSRKYVLGYANRNFLVLGCLMRNDGSAFIFGENYSEKFTSNTQVQEKNIDRLILLMSGKTSKVDLIKLELGEYSLANLTYSMNRNGDMVATGFFRKTETSEYRGIFTIKISAEANQTIQRLNMIDKKTFATALNIGSEDKFLSRGQMDRTLFGYDLGKLFADPDGSYALVAGRRDNTLVIDIRPDMGLHRIRVVPTPFSFAQQRAGDFAQGFLSGFYFRQGDKYFFIFVDPNNGATDDRGKKLRTDTPGRAFLVEMKEIGRLETRPFQSKFAQRPNAILATQHCRQINAEEVFLLGTETSAKGEILLVYIIEQIADVVKF